jgi:hypothetical protein
MKPTRYRRVHGVATAVEMTEAVQICVGQCKPVEVGGKLNVVTHYR